MTIQPGDRVRWQHRRAGWFGVVFLAERILTGTVMQIVEVGDPYGTSVKYALVMDSDGEYRMPAVEQLEQLEPQP